MQGALCERESADHTRVTDNTDIISLKIKTASRDLLVNKHCLQINPAGHLLLDGTSFHYYYYFFVRLFFFQFSVCIQLKIYSLFFILDKKKHQKGHLKTRERESEIVFKRRVSDLSLAESHPPTKKSLARLNDGRAVVAF